MTDFVVRHTNEFYNEVRLIREGLVALTGAGSADTLHHFKATIFKMLSG